MVGGECRDIDNCNRPTGLACEGERWSADECGSGIHVVQGSFWRGCLGRAIACSKNLVGFRGRLPPVGVLCVSTCVTLQHATCRCVEGDVVRFLCMHLVVVSERKIAVFVMCVGELCIAMTRSGADPTGCVSNLQVQVKRVNHICVVNSRFTHGVVVFVWESMCVDDARGASRTALRTHLPAVCPHCAMGQIVLQNIRRAVLIEAVRFVAMVV